MKNSRHAVRNHDCVDLLLCLALIHSVGVPRSFRILHDYIVKPNGLFNKIDNIMQMKCDNSIFCLISSDYGFLWPLAVNDFKVAFNFIIFRTHFM